MAILVFKKDSGVWFCLGCQGDDAVEVAQDFHRSESDEYSTLLLMAHAKGFELKHMSPDGTRIVLQKPDKKVNGRLLSPLPNMSTLD